MLLPCSQTNVVLFLTVLLVLYPEASYNYSASVPAKYESHLLVGFLGLSQVYSFLHQSYAGFFGVFCQLSFYEVTFSELENLQENLRWDTPYSISVRACANRKHFWRSVVDSTPLVLTEGLKTLRKIQLQVVMFNEALSHAVYGFKLVSLGLGIPGLSSAIRYYNAYPILALALQLDTITNIQSWPWTMHSTEFIHP